MLYPSPPRVDSIGLSQTVRSDASPQKRGKLGGVGGPTPSRNYENYSPKCLPKGRGESWAPTKKSANVAKVKAGVRNRDEVI